MIPEREAASRLASAVGKYLDPRWLTDACLETVMSKLVAIRPYAREVFDELDADPRAIGDRGQVLKQQPTLVEDDLDSVEEAAHWHKEQWRDLSALAERLRRRKVEDFDRDRRGADEDDARLSQERRDFAATDAAPRWQAS